MIWPTYSSIPSGAIGLKDRKVVSFGSESTHLPGKTGTNSL